MEKDKNSILPKSIKELTILGFNHGSVSMLCEAAELQYDTKFFRIIKNVEDTEAPYPYKHPKHNISVFEKDDSVQIDEHCPVFFGVSHSHIMPVIYTYFKKNYNVTRERYISIIHPTSVISSSISYDNGLYLEALSVISSFSNVGFGVCIKIGSSIGHHAKLGDYVSINPGVTISGYVEIGNETEIGSGTTILNNIKIGSNCLIGAGSVVTRDIPDGVVAYGNPCKVIRVNERWEKTRELIKIINSGDQLPH